MNKMLIVVDPQNDFISGTLPVPGAQQAMNALAEYVLQSGHKYCCKVVTCDWHPCGHMSFLPSGQWPEHCVQHTPGAAIYPPVIDALDATPGPVVVLRKGKDPDADEYSFMQNPAAEASFEALVEQYQVADFDICGLAGDVCVLNTYHDLAGKYGSEHVHVLARFSPSIDGGAKLSAEMSKNQ